MKAYELLDTPEKWIKNTGARDATGFVCSPDSPKAVCWCLYGALCKCYDKLDDDEYNRIMEKISCDNTKYPWHPMVSWNDSKDRTYEEVYNLLKELDL